MKNIKFPLILTILIIACNCSSNNAVVQSSKSALDSIDSTKTATLWVRGFKNKCYGIAKMECLNVHHGFNLNNPQWEYFYTQIEGFKFEAGYLQKIAVKIDYLDPTQVPADVTSVKYTLVKVLEKRAEILEGHWLLEKINNQTIAQNELDRIPEISLMIARREMAGYDGCNFIRGKIEDLTYSTIKFSNVASTKMACLNMVDQKIEQVFRAMLNRVIQYRIEGDKLIFLDQEAGRKIVYKRKG